MFHILHIIKKHISAIMMLLFAFAATQSFGQDTLAGNYPLLSIKSGNHVIKSVVTVKGKLDIAAGAKIELIEPGIIVCEGAVSMIGELNNKIEKEYSDPLYWLPKYILKKTTEEMATINDSTNDNATLPYRDLPPNRWNAMNPNGKK